MVFRILFSCIFCIFLCIYLNCGSSVSKKNGQTGKYGLSNEQYEYVKSKFLRIELLRNYIVEAKIWMKKNVILTI